MPALETNANTLILLTLLDRLGGEADITFDSIQEAKMWNLAETRNGGGYRYKINKPLNLTYPDSSCINSVTFDPSTHNLIVEYKKSRGTYVYTGVPESVVGELQASSSIGNFMARNIKGKFDCFKQV